MALLEGNNRSGRAIRVMAWSRRESAPSARGINRSGRTTGNTRVAQMADRARSEGVKPRAQAGGAPGDPPRRRRSDAGKPRPKSRTRPLEASTRERARAVSGRHELPGDRSSVWVLAQGLAHKLQGEHDRAGMSLVSARTAGPPQRRRPGVGYLGLRRPEGARAGGSNHGQQLGQCPGRRLQDAWSRLSTTTWGRSC